MSAARTIKVDIISDTVCPWCLVGKRRLETAIEQFKITHPNVSFIVNWHPFQLAPYATTTPKLEHYKRKFGEQRALDIVANMQKVGQTIGVNFSYGGVISNTLDSHRLVHWAKQFGKQNEVVEEVFLDYHQNERDIGDRQVLAAAAGRAGLNEGEALSYLNSEQDKQLVQGLADENKRTNVNGVPNFTIQDKYQFPGAQEPSTFLAFFEKALKDFT